MPSSWVLAATIVPTAAVALLVRRISSRFDAILLMISGVASLILALFATSTMRTEADTGVMSFEMTEHGFNLGVLSPVFIVATLTVMRGIFKFFGE